MQLFLSFHIDFFQEGSLFYSCDFKKIEKQKLVRLSISICAVVRLVHVRHLTELATLVSSSPGCSETVIDIAPY